jgi:hypothetical protein
VFADCLVRGKTGNEFESVLEFDFQPFAHSLYNQCDQIGRIFAQWAIVYFGQLLKKHKSSPNFCATFSLKYRQCINLVKNWFRLHFGRLFYKLIWSPCFEFTL